VFADCWCLCGLPAERGSEQLTAVRPFRLGGCCGCPLETTVLQEDAVLGKAVEDFR
jgi:hypothetical protein